MYNSDEIVEKRKSLQILGIDVYQLIYPQPDGPEIKYYTILLIVTLIFFLFNIIPCNLFWNIIRLLAIHDFYILLKAISSKGGILEPLPSISVEEGQQVVPCIRYKTANGEMIVSWCATCHFYKPPTAHHCRVCNRCVEGFDHHCLWINNCVDTRTQHYFFWVLFDRYSVLIVELIVSGFCTLACCFYLIYRLIAMIRNTVELSVLLDAVTIWDKLLLVIIVGCLLFLPACNKFQRRLLFGVMATCFLLIVFHVFLISKDWFSFIIFFLLACVTASVGIWLTVFLGHYIWLFMNDLTQKQYIKSEMASRQKITLGKAIKKLLSIMLRSPSPPRPPATPPYSPFCYLPPGEYVGSI